MSSLPNDRRRTDSEPDDAEERREPLASAFRYGLAGAVAFAWVASFLVELLSAVGIVEGGYHTPATVHVLMGIVVGSAGGDVALRRVRRRIAGQAAQALDLIEREPDP